ncbi:MAG: hypothetical protein QOJ34_2251 [Pseudonocardiales bacterium]|nr:hypothetical protein [Pseudonocardiales bacterium]
MYACPVSTGEASGYAALTRAQLAVLVPELLLAGHLIDRAGLPHVLVALGPDGMRDVAIEEWRGASPVYTRRMQQALGFPGDDVVTIFKGLQLDIGAPPEFMDFRYSVEDERHGSFQLAHCGALMDVEPMGEDYVRRMCHDIEDPTFDATAVATNAKAVMRPIHRPPRSPADRHPHCAWTVTIDDANDAPPYPAEARVIGATAAASFAGVSAIDPADEGRADYAGPLFADVPFSEFSHSALVRLAEEVALQGHLLTLSYKLAAATRGLDTDDLLRKQFTGAAGVVAGRLRAALELPASLGGAAQLLGVHPALNPPGYVLAEVDTSDGLAIRFDRHSPAVADGGWLGVLSAEHVEPLDAILHAIDPTLRAEVVVDSADELTVRVLPGAAADERPEVAVTRFSTGAAFVLAERRTVLPVLNT